MGKRKKFFQLIATILIFTIVFNLSGSISYAIVSKAQEQKITLLNPVYSGKTQEIDAEVVGEDIEKRTLNEKHFLLSDGSKMAAIYPEEVHYEKNGKLLDIDNTLVKEEKDGESVYTNKANKFTVEFANDTKDDKLVTLTMNNHKIQWSMQESVQENTEEIKVEEELSNEVKESFEKTPADEKSLLGELLEKKTEKKDLRDTAQELKRTEARVLQAEKNIQKVDDKVNLAKLNASIQYKNLMNSIDLQYDVKSNSIKESIIIRDKQKLQDEFCFVFDTGNLIAELTEQKEIIIYEETKDNIIFVMNTPYMFDAKMEYSLDIDLTLEEKIEDENQKQYILKIKPSKEWLLNENRAYPVVIDPTITTSLNSNPIKDTYIYSGDQDNWTKGIAHIIRIGNSKWLGPNGGNPVRGLIKFDLPTLNAGDQIIGANLSIYNYPDTYEWTPPTRAMQIDVHKMNSNWESGSAFWNDLHDKHNEKIEDYIIYQYNSSTPNTCYQQIFNITAIVKDWYTSGNNYGLMLKEHEEIWGYADQSDAYFIAADTSMDYREARPSVTITYRNQTGIEDYLSYHVQDAGRAGTVYTNDYNGNLTLVHSDMQTPGNLMPVSIEHVYNTNDKVTNIGYGKGFRLNLSQTLEKQTIDGTEYIQYIDEDGTRHYFTKISDNHYKDEDGLALTLKLDNNIFTMTDSSGNKQIYHSVSETKWHLKEIIDTSNYKITINYNSANPNLIENVIDGAEKQITLNYSNGLLSSMTDLAGENISYGYTDSFLTNITYQDEKKSWYTYDNNLLYHVRNIDNSALKYYFYNTNPNRVQKIEEYGTDESLGNYLNISYGENTTTILDNKNFKNVISFDQSGRQIGITNMDNQGKQGYGQSYTYGDQENNRNRLLAETNLMKTVNNMIKNGSAEDGTEHFMVAQWGTNHGTLTSTDETSFVGGKSFKLVTTTKDNSYPIACTTVHYLKKNINYTFSVKIKGSIEEKKDDDSGVILFYEYKKTDGNYVTEMSELLPIRSEWGTYQAVFQIADEGYEWATIGVAVRNAKGTIYFDAMQLEEGDTANIFNLVNNGGFEHGMDYWEPRPGQTDTGAHNIVNEDSRKVLRINGNASEERYYAQTVKTNGKAGDSYQFSALVKTSGVPNHNGKTSYIAIGIWNNDNTTTWVDTRVDPSSSEWQYVSRNFVVDKDYQSIQIYLCFYKNANEIYFDDVCLQKDVSGNSYTYDGKGNVINSKDKAKQNSTFQYSGNSELLSVTNPLNGKFTYEYDYKNRDQLVKATNTIGMDYFLTYDEFGNNEGIKIEESRKSDVPADGKTYYMKFASSDKYFDVNGLNNNNGSELQQYDLCQGANQKFTLHEIEDGYFKINPTNTTEKFINEADNTYVVQWSWNNGDNQKWKFIENEDGTYKVINKQNGDDYCLTLEGDSNLNAGKIKVEKWEGKLNQRVVLYEVDGDDHPLDKDFIESNEAYYIKVQSSNLYLTQVSDSAGARIVQKEFEYGNKNQLWKVSRNENALYTLTNLGSMQGRVLDVINGVNAQEQFVQMADRTTPNSAQEWRLERNTDGTFQIVSTLAGTHRTLTVYTNSLSPGKEMVIYDKNNQPNQKFYFEKANMLDIENGATYKIKAKCSNLYVDVDGSNVEQQEESDALTQQWIIKNFNNGYYSFINKSDTSKVLDVCDSETGNGANIQIFTAWGGITNPAQQFEIIPKGDGSYSIRTKTSMGKRSLDVANGSAEPGTNIAQWDNNGATMQDFYFEKISSPNENQYIETNAEYTDDGRFLSKIVDQKGNETQYQYNSNTGTISKIIDAKNAETTYTYDNLDRLLSVNKTEGTNNYQNTYTYENDNLKTIGHNGFNYSFLYDKFNNIQQVKVGEQSLIQNTYEAGNGNLTKATYGNGHEISYLYDNFNRVSRKTGTNGNIDYKYDGRNNLARVQDGVNNETITYTYDLADRLVQIQNSNLFRTKYTYDNNSNVNSRKYLLNELEETINYKYDRDNRINYLSLANAKDLFYHYDRLSRIVKKELRSGENTYITEYEYENTDTPNRTTTSIETVKNGTEELNYTYDAKGNIETISEGEVQTHKYYYDSLDQLIREDNKKLNKTITYTYDNGGNLLNKKEYAYTESNLGEETGTINYSYENTNWKDQLTSYNGKAITYDNIGNPLTYDGNTYTWQNGRQLAGISNTAKEQTITYKYNDEGIRTEKVVNGKASKYYLEGTKVIYEMTGTNLSYFQYDEQGNIIGMQYNGTQYYYIKNLQGDIIGILDNELNQVVKYDYDSWGKVIAITDATGTEITDQTHIGHINPYRYRSYRYDSETGLYYLQSRYYNPEWGRFLNADGLVQTGQGLIDKNMYVYCENNPINRSDENGYGWISSAWNIIKAGISMLLGASSQVSIVQEKPVTSISSIISVNTGFTISTITSSNGDSTKPVSVYANGISNKPLKSNVGLKINIKKYSLDISLGLSDTGIKISKSNGDITNSGAFKIDITKLQIGFEAEREKQINKNIFESAYVNTSINGSFIVAAYMLFQTGNWNSSLQPAY